MKICIIGAGDAGAIAALQIRRLDPEAEIDVFSQRTELGCPPCEMPLALSGTIGKWEDLFRGYWEESFYQKRNINIHLNTRVTDILRQDKSIIAEGKRYEYDKLVLGLGSIPVIPPIQGLNGRNEFTLSTNLADGRALQALLPKYNSVAIIGASFIGLEIADALRLRGYKVYVLARTGILRASFDEDMSEELKKPIAENGVELILPARINGITDDGKKKHIKLPDRELEVDFVFFGTGVKPNIELAQRAGLQIGETGAIWVNQYLQTSDPDIYAAGDCMENWDVFTGSKRCHQLSTNSIRNGYIAGRNIVLNNAITYQGTVMPFVTKIFGYEVGGVGFTEKVAREKEMDVVSTMVTTPRLRQRFNGKPAHYKLIADRKAKALVGAQVISEEIVSGTIDKLAVAIANKMPLINLVQIDSCYSPHVQEDQIAVPLHRLIDELEK